MAEFVWNPIQSVALNAAAIVDASIPCNKGNIFHEDGTGSILLRGNVNNPYCCFARYQVTANCNIALPEGATVVPIAVALSVNGETKPTSRAIFTPAAAEEFGNVTATAIITVPRGCCFNVALRNVVATEDPAVVPAPVIDIQNLNITVARIA